MNKLHTGDKIHCSSNREAKRIIKALYLEGIEADIENDRTVVITKGE